MWKDIPGYKGYYQVSDLGEIRSVDRYVETSNGRRCYRGKTLSPVLNKRGYMKVNLKVSGHNETKDIHRLILAAFVGPAPHGKEVCHNDGDKRNNHLANLRYDTHSNNMLDCRKHGRVDHRPVRRSDGKYFPSITIAALQTGTMKQNIYRVCRGQRKTAGGFSWSYL